MQQKENELWREVRSNGRLIDTNDNGRYALMVYYGVEYTVFQGETIHTSKGSYEIRPGSVEKGRNEQIFRKEVGGEKQIQRIVSCTIEHVEQAFFEKCFQTVKFYRFIEKSETFLCFELVVEGNGDLDFSKWGANEWSGKILQKPCYLRFEWKNGQTRIVTNSYSMRQKIEPKVVLQEVYYSLLGVSRTFGETSISRNDEADYFTIKFLQTLPADNPSLPSHLFSGCGTDGAVFKVLEASCELGEITREEIQGGLSIWDGDCQLSDYDQNTKIGLVEFIDSQAPGNEKEIRLSLVR